MKLTLSFILLFLSTLSIYGQSSNIDNNTPMSLSEEGKSLLLKEKKISFDKALALGKFRNSQKLLVQSKEKNDTLQAENNIFIDELVHYFSSLSNTDSLLQTTIFFPDSTFQSNKKYSNRIKDLIPTILRIKRRKHIKEFTKIKELNFRNGQNKKSSTFILSFEKYWPLEVVEFENYFFNKEKTLKKYSPIVKEILLFSQLNSLFDSINNEIRVASFDLNIRQIRQQKENVEQELLEAKAQYNKLKYIGLGLLGLIFMWLFFSRRKSSQLLKRVNQTLLEEKKRSNELLLNILPAEVAKELKNHAAVKAKKHDAVTVLFSDFINFSGIANQLSPEELVMELDYCFKAFDHIIDKHRLQKIKTIGDAYMCVGGLYTKGNKHVARMILAALEIQKFLERLKKDRIEKGKHFFEARIGIHIGPIVSGVVGSKKFAFDIWGDTVNVAQQMETNGTPGKVNISGQAYEIVKNQFECTPRGILTAKNKKNFEMYFVERKI